ncbi:MAG: ATP-binding protein [Clostridia bacterium]|nr:ATP-binding protein [Clostridia bacterium]
MKELIQILKSQYTAQSSTDSPIDLIKLRVDWYNNQKGNLTGYDCPLCKNKGDYTRVTEDNREVYGICSCMEIRNNIKRAEKSGLKDTIKKYTLDTYQTPCDWQKSMKKAAIEYIQNPKTWFFAGGQAGSGKTHLCTAITAELMYKGKSVRYMPWRDCIIPIKANVTNSEEYLKLTEPLKTVDVLYIDDFFKTPGSVPTAADINIAYEILNYRYNADLITIITSEKNLDEIMRIDIATGSRIFERSKGTSFIISEDKDKNWRIKS